MESVQTRSKLLQMLHFLQTRFLILQCKEIKVGKGHSQLRYKRIQIGTSLQHPGPFSPDVLRVVTLQNESPLARTRQGRDQSITPRSETRSFTAC